MGPIKLAIVGLGKIARDQHLPSLASNPTYQLVAVASPHNKLDGVPSYPHSNLYARFAPLVRERRIDVDLAAFRLVADAFMCGRRVIVDPFIE